MKLLIVTNVSAMLRAFFLPYARHFRALGWQVDAMTSDSARYPECHEAFEQVHDISWSRNPLDPRNLLVAPGQLQAVVAAGGYDLVHVHSPIAAFVTRLSLRRMRRAGRPKVIYTAHGFHFHRGGSALGNLAFLSLEKLAGPWTDHLVVINHEDEAAARRYRLVPEERLCYMPGIGVDLAHYHPEQVTEEQVRALRAELGLASGDQLFVKVAGVHPRKGHPAALAALARLKRPEVKLAFAGDGIIMDEMQRLARRLGVWDQVRFLGSRNDIPVLLKAARAMLLTSEREGLPRSVMEAMSMGTPVIGTRIRGIEDLLADGCGLLTEVNDADAIAAAMARVLDHPQEAAAMVRRGLERVKRYDLEHTIRLHEALYQKALGSAFRAEPAHAAQLAR